MMIIFFRETIFIPFREKGNVTLDKGRKQYFTQEKKSTLFVKNIKIWRLQLRPMWGPPNLNARIMS